METVYYTTIEFDHGATLADLCRTAHVLGYELISFNGYDAADLGYPGNRGPKWAESRLNMAAINEILTAHAHGRQECYCSIFQSAPENGHVLEDDEALAIVRQFTK